MTSNQGSGNPVPSLPQVSQLGEDVLFSATPMSRSGVFTVMEEGDGIVQRPDKDAKEGKYEITLGTAGQGEEA